MRLTKGRMTVWSARRRVEFLTRQWDFGQYHVAIIVDIDDDDEALEPKLPISGDGLNEKVVDVADAGREQRNRER